MNLSDVALIVNGVLIGDDAPVESVAYDSRSMQPGQLYVALLGEYSDGHDFISSAFDGGASGVVTDRDIDQKPYIKVQDTLQAFQSLAEHHRDQYTPKVIAVTGSCGKTTTRAFLENIFSEVGKTHASRESFNNCWGVPITLFGLSGEDAYLVVEIGMNHMGEIEPLTRMAKPDVAIITNAAASHLEGVGTLENVAIEKGTIFLGLSDDGTAIVNGDDHFASYWRHLNKDRNIISFGIKHDSDVMAEQIVLDDAGVPTFTLVLPGTYTEVTLGIVGEHNVANALSAAAAAYALGVGVDAIKAGLAKPVSEKHRLVSQRLPSGTMLIDDSYNANPLSTQAAISLLTHRASDTLLVFGDMAELGEQSRELHAKIGQHAKASGLSRLYTFGEFSKETADAFGEGAQHFEDKAALVSRVKADLSENLTILVKGSRSMKMDEVVSELLDV